MNSTVVVVVMVGALMATACSGSSADAQGSSCREGTSRREVVNEVAAPGASSRGDAVEAELEHLEMTATPEAVDAGVIEGSPGPSTGSETVEIRTSEGVAVTMTLVPLDPGWAVETSSWCAPTSD